MNFKLRRENGEFVQCDSCDFPAPTAGFDWGPPFTTTRDRPQRMLCEFCCTTMASRHTESPSQDPNVRLTAEVWRAAACVYNMLKHGEPAATSGSKTE